MDLRSIKVDDVRACLADLLEQLDAWEAVDNPAAARFSKMIEEKQKIEWVDRRTRLKVVFQPLGGGTVALVSTFWKGVPDPPPPKQCGV
jgi:hypothetical protein